MKGRLGDSAHVAFPSDCFSKATTRTRSKRPDATWVTPVIAVAALLMPLGPMLAWRRADVRAAMQMLRVAFAAALAVMAIVAAFVSPRSLFGLAVTGFGAWLVFGSVADALRRAGRVRALRNLPLRAWASVLAHAGLGVVAFGIAGSTAWRSEAQQSLAPGETLAIAGHVLRFDGVKEVAGYITPVPGGVGPMTITMLVVNTLESVQRALSEKR